MKTYMNGLRDKYVSATEIGKKVPHLTPRKKTWNIPRKRYCLNGVKHPAGVANPENDTKKADKSVAVFIYL